MNNIDSFYAQLKEPEKEILLALKKMILDLDKDISHELKYGMPFFCYKGKMFCYLWIHKKYKQPYIGIVEGKRFDEPFLLQENRSRMKIMLFEPNEDLPKPKIEAILSKEIGFYKTGEIQLRKNKIAV